VYYLVSKGLNLQTNGLKKEKIFSNWLKKKKAWEKTGQDGQGICIFESCGWNSHSKYKRERKSGRAGNILVFFIFHFLDRI